MRNVNEKVIKTSVKESISHLLGMASKEFEKNSKLSKRYAKMAWDLVKKHKVRLTKAQKLMFCRKCHRIWVPGKSVKVVFDNKHGFLQFQCDCGYKRKTK